MAEKGTDHSLTYPILRDEGRYGSSICRTVPYFQLCFHVNFFYFSVNSRDAVGSVRPSERTLPKASHTFLLVLFDGWYAVGSFLSIWGEAANSTSNIRHKNNWQRCT